jgi:hypothetical protein
MEVVIKWCPNSRRLVGWFVREREQGGEQEKERAGGAWATLRVVPAEYDGDDDQFGCGWRNERRRATRQRTE